MEAIAVGLLFGLASFVGVLLADTIAASPFEDGPIPGKPPILAIVAGAALVGILLGLRASSEPSMILYAIVVCALAAIWCTDVRYGLVPDIFTLVPLALVFAFAIEQRTVWPFASALTAFIPFALLATLSQGRGMGWGDAKLAALGGAVLGGETALAAFAAGAFVAATYAVLRRKHKQVIAFAPYLAAAIGAALPLIS